MATEKILCSVEVLTCNSEKTLVACLESVKEFDDIIIVDGNSTDRTIEIAHRYNARVIRQSETKESNVRIKHFADVRNKGIAVARYDWFLYVDSDEYLSQEVVSEIRGIVEKGKNNTYFVYNIPRQSVIKNKILNKLRPSYQTRFFHLEAVNGFIKRVHERIQVKEGYAVGTLEHPEYVPLEDIAILKKKWSGYIDMQLQDIIEVTPKILFLKTKANIRKFLAYWVKYLLGLVKNPTHRLPFWYEYYNALYHLKIIWRVWKLYFKQKSI